jgi:hypothetical protein
MHDIDIKHIIIGTEEELYGRGTRRIWSGCNDLGDSKRRIVSHSSGQTRGLVDVSDVPSEE